MTSCAGCKKVLGVFDAGYSVCMDCTKARQRSATSGNRCKCGSKRRETGVLGKVGRRQFVGCDRCLGVVRQVA